MQSADQIIEQTPFRKDVYDRIPSGSTRILDFGCNLGELLLRLKRDKDCSELYGLDVKEDFRSPLEEYLDGSWIMDLGQPGNDLGEEFEGFFNYIVMHDVVEHLYDPWYILPKLRNCLAPQGVLILVVPNFRYWTFWYQVLLGDFEYGADGGLMNEEHIRWFTIHSVRELVSMSGLQEISCDMIFPPSINPQLLADRMSSPTDTLEVPPAELGAAGGQPMRIQFPGGVDISQHYPHFLANKYLISCQRTEGEVEPRPTTYGSLARRRKKSP